MNTYIWFFIGIAGFLAFAFLKKRKKEAPTKSSTPWILRHSQDALLDLVGNEVHVTVPLKPGYLGTLAWVDEPKLPYGAAVHLRYVVEGGPMVQVEDPNGPAPAMGVMVQRRGDTGSGRGRYDGYRWYHRAMLPLTPGEHSVILNLISEEWGPVMGGDQAASFQECLDEADTLNIVFGGTSGRAHGIYAITPAKVRVLELHTD